MRRLTRTFTTLSLLGLLLLCAACGGQAQPPIVEPSISSAPITSPGYPEESPPKK